MHTKVYMSDNSFKMPFLPKGICILTGYKSSSWRETPKNANIWKQIAVVFCYFSTDSKVTWQEVVAAWLFNKGAIEIYKPVSSYLEYFLGGK